MLFPEWGEKALRNVAALFLPKLTQGNTARQAGEMSIYVSELNQIAFSLCSSGELLTKPALPHGGM